VPLGIVWLVVGSLVLNGQLLRVSSRGLHREQALTYAVQQTPEGYGHAVYQSRSLWAMSLSFYSLAITSTSARTEIAAPANSSTHTA
jgi:hypothetical protein